MTVLTSHSSGSIASTSSSVSSLVVGVPKAGPPKAPTRSCFRVGAGPDPESAVCPVTGSVTGADSTPSSTLHIRPRSIPNPSEAVA